ncbi:AbrB/MazE/SpoVT family DNA-binding domain-containing protein [Clostridiales Family XIII bacterium ASD5510]|uniref:AbrB/MazE/SpoVT family DNA-binding domain-containing protein n=2 Tax=Hominibacterium faecale TaxID=2839743 RepID=A0A9J6QTS0_9FIRM|nr:AbrB/MazE/SpoVT family DNA-binding domain-containing protein [Hominibacterium faecale]MCU7379541.1 AbrB/MazE/SpoVT family DNA-binding domain-containing protein [Hominibacterium faecale]
MKNTGIVRRIDDLGRVVVPRELRRSLQIENGDEVETFMEGDRIILKKYEPGCVICGSMDEIAEFRGKPICGMCRAMLREEL